MYTIREDSVKKLLTVEVSGKVRNEEALRAISQAFALADASEIRAIRCEITDLRKGPAGLMTLAATLTLHHRPGMRLANRHRRWGAYFSHPRRCTLTHYI